MGPQQQQVDVNLASVKASTISEILNLYRQKI